MRKIAFLILIMSVMTTAVFAQAKPFTVVIDAGHGGKDAGAVAKSKLMEKSLNLDVALRLASKIRTAYPEVKVVLTRDKDKFITLQGRADIVNKNDADLFICIHTNAAANTEAKGAETFILGTEKMGQNLDVAMRENAVIKLEEDYQSTYQGFDPNSIDSYIMFELMQNNYMDQSLKFASLVQTQFSNELRRDNRGVRQAAFWVLLKSACPSILVEMGFLSNEEEAKYLASDQGKREITDAIFRAFGAYYAKESVAPALPQVQPADSTKPALITEETPAKEVSPVTVAEPHVSWRVQILASKTIIPESDSRFKGVKGCTYREVKGLYKYMVGNCATKEEAVALQQTLKAKFPDCFVVKIEQ